MILHPHPSETSIAPSLQGELALGGLLTSAPGGLRARSGGLCARSRGSACEAAREKIGRASRAGGIVWVEEERLGEFDIEIKWPF